MVVDDCGLALMEDHVMAMENKGIVIRNKIWDNLEMFL
jgi:hypothetical protein